MRRLLSLAVAVVVFGCVALTHFSAFAMIDLDAFSSAVVFLKNSGGEFGTGFFVSTDKGAYLVTASHVAKIIDTHATVTIRSPGDKPETFSLAELSGAADPLPWRTHHEADVAVLLLNPPPELIKKHLQGHFLPTNILYTEKKAPPRNVTLTVLGFPLALGVTGAFSPISRETKPASGFLVLPRFDTKLLETFFLTQEPSVGGFSGAPIIDTGLPRLGGGNAAITVSDNPLGLVGIIHGTLSDPTGGKMGAVVPTYYLWELLTEIEGTPPKQ